MKIRQKWYRVGDIVKVKKCEGAYPLPEGLPEGATVKVVARDVGYTDVEFEGSVFRVAMPCADSGFEEV